MRGWCGVERTEVAGRADGHRHGGEHRQRQRCDRAAVLHGVGGRREGHHGVRRGRHQRGRGETGDGGTREDEAGAKGVQEETEGGEEEAEGNAG